jgi:hypothetical protein
MHERIVAGTDVAMIGAWDADRAWGATPAGERKGTLALLEREAKAGRLFLVRTGGDGEEVVDLYVDEDVPVSVRTQTGAVQGEFLLSVPSGRLTVGGVEDYGAAKPVQTSEGSSIAVPAGDYRLRCHVSRLREEQPEQSLPEVMRDTLGPDDLAYYRRQGAQWKVTLLAIPPLLLFPVLAFPFGWKVALAVTALVAWPYGTLLERWSKRRVAADARWQRLNRIVDRAWRGTQTPSLILELRAVADPAGLAGGSISLDEVISTASRRS